MIYIDNIPEIPNSFFSIDIEGNGYWDEKQDIVELAIIDVASGIISQPATYLFKPSFKINPIAKKIHGIGNEDVEKCGQIDTKADEIKSKINNRNVLFHNAPNDIKLLEKKLDVTFPLVIDTFKLAKKYFPNLKSYKLLDIINHFSMADRLEIESEKYDFNGRRKAHSAAYDAFSTIILLNILREKSITQGSLFCEF